MLTKQEIIAMAMESGLAEVTDSAESLPVEYVEALAKFAGLSAKLEREACIRDCLINISPQSMAEGDWPQEAAEMVKFCIEDIRTRNNKENQQ